MLPQILGFHAAAPIVRAIVFLGLHEAAPIVRVIFFFRAACGFPEGFYALWCGGLGIT